MKRPLLVLGSLVLAASVSCFVIFGWGWPKSAPSGYVVGEAHDGRLSVYLVEENQSPFGFFNASWALRIELWVPRRPVASRIIFEDFDARHDLPKVLGVDYSAESGLATVRFMWGGEARAIKLEVGSGEGGPEDYVRARP